MNFTQKNRRLVNELRIKGITDETVLDAMLKIPRHRFVPDESKTKSYMDFPLPIGSEQTISQPYTVAFMLQALELKETDKVLEIGTGSGWNAALIACIVKKGFIYTTEIIPVLAALAKENIDKIRPDKGKTEKAGINKVKLKNIQIINCDGSLGYEKEAPYDKIIATCAAPDVLETWLKQLKVGGILIAPVGAGEQEMVKIRKVAKDKMEKEFLGEFVFVPLKGKHMYQA